MKSEDAVAGLAALAHPSRLALFRLLIKRGPEGYTPSQLAGKLDVPPPTLSFHLKELQRAQLIEFRRAGRFLHYRAHFPHINALIEFLTENCCALGDKDCNPAYLSPTAESAQPKRNRA